MLTLVHAARSGSTTFWERHCLAVDLSGSGRRGKGKGKQVVPAKPIVSQYSVRRVRVLRYY